MPRGSEYPEDVDHDNPGDLKISGNYGESLIRITRDWLKSQSRHESKSKVQQVKKNKEKQENARGTLEYVKPVATIRVIQNVWLSLG